LLQTHYIHFPPISMSVVFESD